MRWLKFGAYVGAGNVRVFRGFAGKDKKGDLYYLFYTTITTSQSFFILISSVFLPFAGVMLDM